MTCIIGLEQDGRAYIGVDSFIGNSSWSQTWPGQKMFRLGPYLIAVAGSPRITQIIRYHFVVQAQDAPGSSIEHLVCNFILPLRELLKEHGAANISESTETLDGSVLIMAYQNRIFKVDSDFQVARYGEAITSAGYGMYLAIGAMSALKKLPPKKRIRKALKITAKESAYVSPPFYVEKL